MEPAGAPASPAIVEVQGLRVTFGTRDALAGIDLSIAKGEMFGLLGPNGGGKSTLFRVLATLLAPGGGRATVCGRDVARDPHGVRRKISVVFQSPSLDKKLTVVENLRHQGHMYGLGGRGLEARIREVMERFSLTERAGERTEVLSGGLKRRVEIGKALLHDPEVLMMDEPTTGLDPSARREVWDYVMDARRRSGMTVLVTTHLMDEADRCDRVAILHRGQVCALGTPEALRREVGGDVVQVRSKDPAALRARIVAELGVEAAMVDGMLRIEGAGAAATMAAILAKLGDAVEEISLSRPTLEDAFVRRTGKTFSAAELADEAA